MVVVSKLRRGGSYKVGEGRGQREMEIAEDSGSQEEYAAGRIFRASAHKQETPEAVGSSTQLREVVLAVILLYPPTTNLTVTTRSMFISSSLSDGKSRMSPTGQRTRYGGLVGTVN